MSRPVVMEPAQQVGGAHARGSLWLVGGLVAQDARTSIRADIEIFEGNIKSILVCPENKAHCYSATPSDTVDLRGHLILPGLINAHDHLEFNLFPRLGRGPYSDYKEWAADIYHPAESPLREHLAVPEAVRLWWGGLKNLLAGVTTVSHHNRYVSDVFENEFPVRVVKRFAWSHSLAFGRNLKDGSLAASNDVPFILHLGEGTDARSADEIFELDKLGGLHSRTVIVHGVALNDAGRSLLEEHEAALVWCPTSNIFTLGKTLEFATVANYRRIALGSDSALTAQGDLLDEIRFAHRHEGVSTERVYSMVTDLAADVLRLRNGEGSLRRGAPADLLVLNDTGKSPSKILVEAGADQIGLVLKNGEVNLLSSDVSRKWPEAFKAGLEPLNVQGVPRLVRAPLKWLFDETRKHLGSGFRVSGREVSL